MKTISFQLSYEEAKAMDNWISDHLVVFQTRQAGAEPARLLGEWQWNKLKRRTALETSIPITFLIEPALANAFICFIALCEPNDKKLGRTLDKLYAQFATTLKELNFNRCNKKL